jgi:hypothetical protein
MTTIYIVCYIESEFEENQKIDSAYLSHEKAQQRELEIAVGFYAAWAETTELKG